MKKIIGAFLFIITLPAFGQNHFLGVKGGINHTNVKLGTAFLANDYRNGIVGGLTYDYHIGKRFTIGAELLYAQKGFNSEIIFTNEFGIPTGENIIINYNYDYISLPIKGGVFIGKTVKGFANLGVVTSVLVNAKNIIPEFDIVNGMVYDLSSQTNTLDFSGLIELGVSYDINSQLNVFTALAYQQSFRPIIAKNAYGQSNTKHYGFNVSVGIKYALSNT